VALSYGCCNPAVGEASLLLPMFFVAVGDVLVADGDVLVAFLAMFLLLLAVFLLLLVMFLLLLAMFLLLLPMFFVAVGDVLVADGDVLVAVADVLVADGYPHREPAATYIPEVDGVPAIFGVPNTAPAFAIVFVGALVVWQLHRPPWLELASLLLQMGPAVVGLGVK
jgi:hypothetical protein